MCGLVGVAGNLTNTSMKVMTQLLLADQFRGMHSTGVAGVKNGSAAVYKRALNATDFLQLKKTNDVIDMYCDAIIGHNRYATQGTVNDVNAHPFEHGEITLVHNGTLRSQYGLPDHHKFQVDSDNICYAMSQWEPAQVLEELSGAYALVWHDERDDTLHFARNEERELCLAYANGVVYWASESKMLDWILDRNNIAKYELMELPAGKHFVLSMNDKIEGWKTFSVEDFSPKPQVYTGYYGTGAGTQQQKQTTQPGAKVVGDTVQRQLAKEGYYRGQELDFFADKWVPYKTNPTRGNLVGFDIDNSGHRIVVFGVDRGDVVFDMHNVPSMDVMYSSIVSGLTHLQEPQGPAVTLDVKSLQWEELSPGTVFEHEQEEDEKKSQPSSTNTQYCDMLVDGVMFFGKEIPSVLDNGCAWCGNPFSIDGLREAKVTQDGHPVHKMVCWDQYEEEMGEKAEC